MSDTGSLTPDEARALLEAKPPTDTQPPAADPGSAQGVEENLLRTQVLGDGDAPARAEAPAAEAAPAADEGPLPGSVEEATAPTPTGSGNQPSRQPPGPPEGLGWMAAAGDGGSEATGALADGETPLESLTPMPQPTPPPTGSRASGRQPDSEPGPQDSTSASNPFAPDAGGGAAAERPVPFSVPPRPKPEMPRTPSGSLGGNAAAGPGPRAASLGAGPAEVRPPLLPALEALEAPAPAGAGPAQPLPRLAGQALPELPGAVAEPEVHKLPDGIRLLSGVSSLTRSPDYAADDKEPLAAAGPEGIPFAYVRGVPADADDLALGRALDLLREKEGALPEHLRLGHGPRPVYEIGLGSITTQYHLRARRYRRQHATAHAQLNGYTLEQMEGARYLTEQDARDALAAKLSQSAAPLEVKDIEKLESDANWEVVRDQQDHVRYQLINALQTFLQHAQEKEAVLYIPFYQASRGNPGAELFDKVLQLCSSYPGPIVVSVPDAKVAFRPEDIDKEVQEEFEWLPGEKSATPHVKSPCLRGTTHLITMVPAVGHVGSAVMNFPADQKLVKLIAGDHAGELKSRSVSKVSSKVSASRHGGDRPGSPVHRSAAPAGTGGAGPKPRAMIAINGGRSMLWQLAAAAEAKIPILMLQGTGRLCDNVPKVWLQRSNGSFDAEARSEEVLAASGFHKGGEEYFVLLGSVLRARLIIHSLKCGPEALQRSLQYEFDDREHAFINAKDLCIAYHGRADERERLAMYLNLVYFLGGLLITVLSVCNSYVKGLAYEDYVASVGSVGAMAVAFEPKENLPLKYILVVLPVLLTVAVAFRKDLNFRAQAVAFRYGASLVEYHLWQYSSCTGPYSAPSLAGSDDVATARATRLLDEMVHIQDRIIDKDTTVQHSAVKDEEFEELTERPVTCGDRCRRLCRYLSRCCGLRVPTAEQIGRLPSSMMQDDFGRAYMGDRLLRRLEHQQAREASWQRQVVVIKFFTYLAGATGSILAIAGFDAWIAVSTAFTTAIAAWESESPLVERLRRSRAASRALTKLRLQWLAKPREQRCVQENLDELVVVAERAFLSVVPMPPEEGLLSYKEDDEAEKRRGAALK